MKAFWHPSDRRLREWLLAGAPAEVGLHLDRCERCADRLEQIDDSAPAVFSLDGRSTGIGETLTALLHAPTDLDDRIVDGIERRRKAEAELALTLGLLAIPVDTGRLVVPPNPDATLEGDEADEGRAHDTEDTT